MTRVERQKIYLDTFLKLTEQAADHVPPHLLETWLGGGGDHVPGTGRE